MWLTRFISLKTQWLLWFLDTVLLSLSIQHTINWCFCVITLSVCFTNIQTHTKETGVFKKAKQLVCNNLNVCNQNRNLLLTVLGTQRSLANQNISSNALCLAKSEAIWCNHRMCTFDLSHRFFWIGNSHCALIKAPNTDSQKTINYSSRLDWQYPVIGWLLSFSQVPCSQSV